jgi:hypothetical protein
MKMSRYRVLQEDRVETDVIADAAFMAANFTNYTLVEEEVLPPKVLQEAARKAAYTSEADPLFFMSQRGEATVEEWQAKVAEIKARYPYPEETQA